MRSYDSFGGYLRDLNNDLRQIATGKIPDPLVMKTEWLAVNWCNEFCARELVNSAGRLVFRATDLARRVYLFLILAGAGSALINAGTRIASGKQFQFKTVAQLVFSGIIAAAGSYLMARRTKDIVFDTGRGVFWKGGSSHDDVAGNDKGASCRIRDIHALQLIPIHNPGPGAYFTYELNLVLESGKRISVLNHGDRDTLVRHTGTVASVISKPVWDVIDESMAFYKQLNKRT